jgi:hypothetical protein
VLAELCLWIGYLQWHLRTRGKAALAEPVISKFHTIENRDAVLVCDRIEPLRDAHNGIVTQWDGHTLKTHPVTGEEVPDESAKRIVYAYVNPQRAEWPAADFIVGNPPFIGPARMRAALGDGYTETLRTLYSEVPESADFVMYWWHKAACLVRERKAERFGFITTNSLRQTFNRRVLEAHLGGSTGRYNPDRPPPAQSDTSCATAAASTRAPAGRDVSDRPPTPDRLDASRPLPLSLRFAIPDHPWVENADGAAVRIAMTVAGLQRRDAAATLQTVTAETEGAEGSVDITLATRIGTINADLTIGADVAGAITLKANENLTSRGVMLFGAGFIVTREEAAALGLGRIPGLERHIREYRNGKDLTSRPRDVMVIDLFGLTESEVRDRFPEVYQWVHERVKPERDANRDGAIRLKWWIHGRPRTELRDYLVGLPRYIATVETSKHRFFQFLDASVLPDNKLICIAQDDAYVLGVLSSRIHVAWALTSGSHLGVGNDPVYVKSRCFETFPFPNATAEQKSRIRDIAERLDAHRKRQLALHAALTMTDLYNVLSLCGTGVPPNAAKLRGCCHLNPNPNLNPNPLVNNGLRLGLRLGLGSKEELNLAALGGTPMPQKPLTPKQRAIHDQGLITVLRQLHDELDAAVAAAYGWEASLADAAILDRLVALNRARADEESRGIVRYLRPAYQQPHVVPASADNTAAQTDLDIPTADLRPPTAEPAPLAWPDTLADQIALVRGVIHQTAWQQADGAKTLASHFTGVRAPTIQRLVDALAALGQVG